MKLKLKEGLIEERDYKVMYALKALALYLSSEARLDCKSWDENLRPRLFHIYRETSASLIVA